MRRMITNDHHPLWIMGRSTENSRFGHMCSNLPPRLAWMIQNRSKFDVVECQFLWCWGWVMEQQWTGGLLSNWPRKHFLNAAPSLLAALLTNFSNVCFFGEKSGVGYLLAMGNLQSSNELFMLQLQLFILECFSSMFAILFLTQPMAKL